MKSTPAYMNEPSITCTPEIHWLEPTFDVKIQLVLTSTGARLTKVWSLTISLIYLVVNED